MYVEKLCNVVVSSIRVLLSEGGPNSCGLLLDEYAFVCNGLSGVNSTIGDGDEEHRPCMLVFP